jgi:hypothetical protein
MSSPKYSIIITEYQAAQPTVEVNGTTITSTLEGSAIKGLTEKILSEEGLPTNPVADKWYPQQKWLNVLRKIHQKYGSLNLKMIGKKIPETANFPPEVNNIEAGLDAIGMAYRMNHRGGEIGYYKYVKTGDREGYVEAQNPYPCDFDIGIVEGMAKRFVPAASVRHIDGECRKNHGIYCRYKVNW